MLRGVAIYEFQSNLIPEVAADLDGSNHVRELIATGDVCRFSEDPRIGEERVRQSTIVGQPLGTESILAI